MIANQTNRARKSRWTMPLACAVLALAVAGCGKKIESVSTAAPPPPPPPATANPATALLPPTVGLSAQERLARVVDLLQQGSEAQARVELAETLRQQPSMREAEVLKQTLDTDPKALFGADSFAYRVGPHETLITVAVNFLGDSYKFYGLARYNGISVPNAVKPGDMIQIPGRFREPANRPPARPSSGEDRPEKPQVAPPVPEARPANPAQAQRMRRAGLERMSAGFIDQAVGLLEQAQRLDPANGAITADLGRARRVQAAVRNRR
jgi:hypothetical protein